MAKKNYLKELPKIGGTAVMTLAMAAALATPANATEVEPAPVDAAPAPVEVAAAPVAAPAPAAEAPAAPAAEAPAAEAPAAPVELPATNGAVEETNSETVVENNDIADTNDQTVQDNNDIADNNEANSNGQLEAPELDLPDAPELPDTDGMTDEEYNGAVGDYNDAAGDYNEAVDDYNGAVEDYNGAVEDFNQAAQDQFEKDQQQYEDDKAAHEDAQKEYEDQKQQYDENNEAYQQYQKDLEEYEKLQKEYEDKLAQYEQDKENHGQNSEAYQQYLKDLETYENLQKEYEDKLSQYEQDKEAHDQATSDYNQYQKDLEEYEKLQKEYEDKLAQYEQDKENHDQNSEAYQQYLKDLEEYEKLQKEYEDKLAQYEQDKEAHDQNTSDYNQYLKDLEAYEKLQKEYEDKLAQFEKDSAQHGKDSEAYQQYLKDLEAYKKLQKEYKDKLDQYEQDKKEHDQLVTENEIYDEVSDYNEKVEADNTTVNQQNKDLEDGLHADLVDNLGAVGEINKNVTVEQSVIDTLNGYGALVSRHEALEKAAADLENHAGKNASLGSGEYAQYLAAVEAYNEEVKAFNQAVDAYNNAVTKYNEAVDAYNANKPEGPTSSSTGAGTQQGSASIDWGNVDFGYSDRQHGDYLTHMDVKYGAAASKDATVKTDENGNVVTDENGNPVIEYNDNVTKYTVTGVYKDKATAEANGAYGLQYSNDGKNWDNQALKEDFPNNEFGNTSWNHTGEYLDPVTGQISFYVTLKDSNGNTHGITVNMNAGSVYADGSYYLAESNDFLKNYVGKDGQGLKTTVIDGVTYYDVSGESVFLISALTCDGMTNHWGKLNAHGLDLILNLQTMIEIHQSANAQKVSYQTYELGKTAQAYAPGKPGEAPVAPTEPTAPDHVEKPGDAPIKPTEPTAPDHVEKPGDAPIKPTAPTAPDYVKNPGNAPIKPTAPTAPDHVEKPGDAPVAPTAPIAPDHVEKPGDAPVAPTAPIAPDHVDHPGEAPVDPGQFDKEAPKAPTLLDYLEYVEKLDDGLFQKVIVVIPDVPYVDPNPTPISTFEVVRTTNLKTTMTIEDEKIPLAKAPKTGDLSGIWAMISGLSLGGVALLNRKRKEEE